MSGEYQIPIWTASQTNRCHLLTDMVDTPDGKIEIGKLKVGDKVLTHKGYRDVTHLFPIEKQPVYKVKLKSGKEINISANHMVPVSHGKIKSIETGLKIGDKLFTKKL
jgi:intein/homing endonuclease